MPGPLEVVEMLPAAPHAPGPVQPEALAAPSRRATRAAERLRARAPLLAILAVALYPLFAHLGGPALWEDEGDTAVFARAIARSGLPLAWDGKTVIDSDFGGRLTVLGDELVMVGTPWLGYYATAASFVALGESRLAARLPSAAAALATIALLFALVRRTTGDARAAVGAALLLLCSAQFLLYAREARHYALNMLLTLAVLAAFLRLRERPRSPWFAASAVLLFHTQILPAAVCVAACGALATLHPGFRDLRRPFWRALPWIAAGTSPWLLLSWRETGTNWSALAMAGDLPLRAGQLAIESGVAVPWLGWAIGIPLLWPRFGERDRAWLALAFAFIAAVFALHPLALNAELTSTLALRYACGLLPVAAGVSGLVVARASGRSRAAFAAGLALFGFTHLPGGALSALWLGESRPLGRSGLYMNVPRETAGKLANLELWDFLRALGRPDPGTASRIAAWLRPNARPGDALATNYSWENLYFESGVAPRMLLGADEPLRGQAASVGIPTEVFGVDGLDWVVWRHALPPQRGYSLSRIRAELAARGAELVRAASFRETQWENRPELHWHRFPDVGYPFAPARLGPAGIRYRDAVIYRVVPRQESDAARPDGGGAP